MKLEDRIRHAMDSQTRSKRMPDGALVRIRSKARRRRAAGAGLFGGLAVLLIVIGVNIRLPASPKESSQAASAATLLTVPNVVGMQEGDALKELYTAGLSPVVEEKVDAHPLGMVIETDPAPGTEVVDNSVVTVVVSGVPSSGPAESDLAELARIAESRPDVFVGAYRDHDGNLHAVFNPGTSPEDWRSRLEAAVPSGVELYLNECQVSRQDLMQVLDTLKKQDWSPHASQVAFAAEIDPATCSVVMTTQDLTNEDRAALETLFGSKLRIDESGEPALTVAS